MVFSKRLQSKINFVRLKVQPLVCKLWFFIPFGTERGREREGAGKLRNLRAEKFPSWTLVLVLFPGNVPRVLYGGGRREQRPWANYPCFRCW